MRLSGHYAFTAFAAPCPRSLARRTRYPMRPTTPTTDAERKVIRWLFGLLAIVALVFIGITWHSRSADCDAACRAKGATSGQLRFNGGGRLNLGAHCECVGSAPTTTAR
ncbi:MAG: hypothetical protein WCF44_18135 [Candidatus Methylophosphatis roskildensis]